MRGAAFEHQGLVQVPVSQVARIVLEASSAG